MTYQNNILLEVLNKKEVERPPVWAMRQAGRILPGYRKIRASVSGFKELVKRPDLIAEVTLEPVDVLGVDAAILFSDILVIPEAMGVDYDIVEKKGPVFKNPITELSQIGHLNYGQDCLEDLSYVFESIGKTKKTLDNRVPLIGFSGAPWTLFAYMIEGGGSKTFAKARRFLYEEPEAAHDLLDKITETIIVYLKQKIAEGCDTVQLFDSWASMLSVEQYQEFCLPYVDRIFAAIDEVPKIFFPKGAWSCIPLFRNLQIDAISIDWLTPINYVRQHLGNDIIVQGNFDPANLYAPVDQIQANVQKKIEEAGKNHIFNLGHGVYPDTDRNHVKSMIDAIKSSRY